MKKILTLFFLSLSVFAFGQTAEDTVITDHYKTATFDCVIFPESYNYVYLSEHRFTPTRQDIDAAEKALQSQLEKLNSKLYNQPPIIHKNLKKYRRQYFGYIDSSGNKILLINCFWYNDLMTGNWLKNKIEVLDGGSYYWNVKYDMKEDKLFELYINGKA